MERRSLTPEGVRLSLKTRRHVSSPELPSPHQIFRPFRHRTRCTSRWSSLDSTKKRASFAKGAACSAPSSPRLMGGHCSPERESVTCSKEGRSKARRKEPEGT
jgi:hypothetical protein